MKDMFGYDLYVGDKVVYPGRSGSSLWMSYGIVTSVEQDGVMVRREAVSGPYWHKGVRYDTMNPVAQPAKPRKIVCTETLLAVANAPKLRE